METWSNVLEKENKAFRKCMYSVFILYLCYMYIYTPIHIPAFIDLYNKYLLYRIQIIRKLG